MSAARECPVRLSLGAYVLGTLEAGDRARVAAHLDACPSCRAESADLTPVASLLLFVEDDVLADARPSPRASRHRTLRRPGRVRLRATRSRAAVAVVVAAALAAVIADLPAQPGNGGRTVEAADARTHAGVRIVLRPTDTGTVLRVRVRGVRPGSRCRLLLTSRAGAVEAAGSWRAGYAGHADVTASTSLRIAELASARIVSGDGRPLVEARL